MNFPQNAQLSPLAEAALSQASDEQASEFHQEMRSKIPHDAHESSYGKSVERAAEGPSGLVICSMNQPSGAE